MSSMLDDWFGPRPCAKPWSVRRCEESWTAEEVLRAQKGARLTRQLPHAPSMDRPPRPVLNRLRQVRGLDLLTSRQVGDGAGELQDAVERPAARLKLLRGGPYQTLPGLSPCPPF